MNRRVVVTGMGMITPLGKTVEKNWQNVLAGKSGIGRTTFFDPSAHKSQVSGEAADFNPENALAGTVPIKELRRMDRFSQFGLYAAREAIIDARLILEQLNRKRIGVCLGVGGFGFEWFFRETITWREKGPSRVSAYTIPAMASNMASGLISIAFGLTGFGQGVSAACASGSHAIGDGLRSIQRGESDIVLAGGTEAPISPVVVAGFENTGALSTRWNEEPERASRPFDKDRDGFIISEGAGILVLEESGHALRRNARIYGELIGFARNSDGFHITMPSVEGAAECMIIAIEDAGVRLKDVGYINAHGTSTPSGDICETKSIKLLFGELACQVPISSTKGATGHLIGAAGAIEAIFTILALRTGIVPPTANLENPDPECDLDYIPNRPRRIDARVAISNSFGFGGQNGCLVFGKFS